MKNCSENFRRGNEPGPLFRPIRRLNKYDSSSKRPVHSDEELGSFPRTLNGTKGMAVEAAGKRKRKGGEEKMKDYANKEA